MFIFSWGRIRKVSEICAQFITVSGIPLRLQSIPHDHGVVFAGHSEGSGWALCAHDYMRDVGLPQERRAIVTGSLMLDFEFMQKVDANFKETTLFLIVAGQLSQAFSPLQRILTDVLTLSKPDSGATLPQFGYACTSPEGDKPISCLSPQPPLDIQESINFVREKGGMGVKNMLTEIHYFLYYSRCFEVCLCLFEMNNDDFGTNIPYYTF